MTHVRHGRAGGGRRDDIEESLRVAIDRLGPLPVLDGTVQRVLALAGDPEADTRELAAIVERDATFSANLLRAANAAGTGRRAAATTISQALVVVGREGVRRVALEAATYRLLERVSPHGETAASLHAHAVAVAAQAAAIAERARLDPGAAHLAGLLHDLGKVVLPMVVGATALDAALAGTDRLTRPEAERREFGLDHAEAGATLATTWDMPPAVVDAIARHHGPEPAPGVAGCVQVANELVHLLAGNGSATLLAGTLEALGLGPESLDDVLLSGAGGHNGDVEAVRAQMRELEQLANNDALTGVANRRRWTELVDLRLRSGEQGSVLLVDVDEFKQVNDGHGHAAGDAVLRAVAAALEGVGLAGRIGGDEFALWAPVDAPAAAALAEAVIAEVRRTTAPVLGGRPCAVSIGIAPPREGAALAHLLDEADAALYASKRGGRARATVAAGEGSPPAVASRGGAPAIRTAGDALRCLLAAHVSAVNVRGRAREPVEGVRAAEVVDRALDRLCAGPAADLVLTHALHPSLLDHGTQTAALAAVAACRLFWDDERCVQLVVAALLADVGMRLIDQGVREKPAALTRAERDQVRRHCELGAELLAAIAQEWPLAPYVAYEHHEMWDGSGYPVGLSGPAIRDESQLVGLCHRYIAAVTPRPHRAALPPHEAVELLFTLRNRLAREEIVHAFTEAVAAYPVGSFVRLSNGVSGRVLPGGAAARPRVLGLWQGDGAPLGRREIISLGEHRTLFVVALAP